MATMKLNKLRMIKSADGRTVRVELNGAEIGRAVADVQIKFEPRHSAVTFTMLYVDVTVVEEGAPAPLGTCDLNKEPHEKGVHCEFWQVVP